MIITEKGVFEIDPDEGMVLTELGEGFNVEDIVETTGAMFKVCSFLTFCTLLDEV